VKDIKALKRYRKPTEAANMTSKQAVSHLALSLGGDVPDDSGDDSGDGDASDDEVKGRAKTLITWGALTGKGQDACDKTCQSHVVQALFVAQRFRHWCVSRMLLSLSFMLPRLPGSNTNESYHRSLDNDLPRVAGRFRVDRVQKSANRHLVHFNCREWKG
jgi:hypothetical protein